MITEKCPIHNINLIEYWGCPTCFLDPQDFETAVYSHARRVANLVITKHRTYGSGNIDNAGLTGLYVRLGDKLNGRMQQWLRTAILGGEDPLNVRSFVNNEEAAKDLIDIPGYGLINLMWLDGTFHLPLKE